MKMYAHVDAHRSAVVLAVLALLASGCASNPTERVVFESAAKDIKLAPRAAAQPTSASREQLVADDHFEIGRLTVSHEIEQCEGADRDRNCKAIAHKEAPSRQLLREAAARGGDVVRFDKLDERKAATGTRQGKCLGGRNVMQSVSVPTYEQDCRYTSGGIQTCSPRQTGSRMEQRSVFQCTSWETIAYAATTVTSSGGVWRRDPVYAKDARLRLALEQGTRRQVAALIPDRATAETPLLDRRKPWEVALKADNANALAALLDRGLGVNAADSSGDSMLYEAARVGAGRCASLLVLRGAKVDASGAFGDTPLMEASAKGRTDIIQLLLRHGAHVNADNRYGETALAAAADSGRTDAVRLLLGHGADANHRFSGLYSHSGNRTLRRTALMQASQRGHTDIMQLLLRHRADVNARDDDGWTALMSAAGDGHVEAVRLLLRHGADANIAGRYGGTALSLATKKKQMHEGYFAHQKEEEDRAAMARYDAIVRLLGGAP